MTALLTAEQVTEPGWCWWRGTENHQWIPTKVTPCRVQPDVMTFSPHVQDGPHVDLYGFFVKAATPEEPADAKLSIEVDISSVEHATAALERMAAAADRARAAVTAIGVPFPV